jgi:hypothetical protein
VAKNPALEELMKAPKIINDEMSCCRPGEMLYPMRTVGSGWPKTWSLVNNGRFDGEPVVAYLEEAGHGLQTANGTEINAVLERRHGHEGAREEAFPVLQQALAGRCFEHGDKQLPLDGSLGRSRRKVK